jgi:hypothetical protein
MPAERLTIRKIREVFRLKFDCGLSNRQIAKSCAMARSTVADYLLRLQQAGLSWPLPDDIDDNQVEQRLYPPLPTLTAEERPLKRAKGSIYSSSFPIKIEHWSIRQ